MKQSVLDLKNELDGLLGSAQRSSEIKLNELTLELEPKKAHDAFLKLRDEAKFDQLIDICGVDYLTYGEVNWEKQNAANTGFSRGVFDFAVEEQDEKLTMPRRFAVVYHLLSVARNLRVRVKVFPEDVAMPKVASVVDIWSSANWFEREAFDLFGILFEGHPDLRRILTDYGFVGHPLRKDFPLTGHVEMRYDVEQERCVYEPVTIENRVNVPRVIRDIEVSND